MNQRQRAIQVLRDAKQILSQRLLEHVTESADEILADARGDSYMNEIESLYEQIGVKLSHVSQMLSNFPAESAPQPATPRPKSAPSPKATTATNALIVATTIPAGLPAPIRVDLRALPPPKPKSMTGPFAPHRALSAFAAQVQIGNLRAAGHTLAVLFDLDELRAIACVAVFAERMASDPDFSRRAAQLRIELQSGGYQRVHSLLFECFGLRPSEAFAILKVWRRRTPLGS